MLERIESNGGSCRYTRDNLKHFREISFYWVVLALFKDEIKDYDVAFGASLML